MIRNEETLKQTLATIDRFVLARLMPAEEQVDREGVIPDDIVDELRQLGLGGLALPEEFGGVGLTVEEKMHVAVAFGRTSPAFYRRLISNDGLGFALVRTGTDEQKRKWSDGWRTGRCRSMAAPVICAEPASNASTVM